MNNKNNVIEFPEAEAVEHEAALWVMRLDTHDLSAGERSELKAWLNRSAHHQEAMDKMAAVWGIADWLEECNRIDPVEEDERAIWRPPFRFEAIAAIAASLLLVCGVVVWQLDLWPSRTQTATFETAVGIQKSATLADGSTIYLNTNTSAEVEINQKLRIVRLLHGEAHFEVAKDPKRPFRVYAREGFVEAVGTAFSVRVLDDDIEVTVAEGVVQLFARDDNSEAEERRAKSGHASNYRSLAAVSVNEHVVFDKAVEARGKLDDAAIERKLTWRSGLLSFSGETLAEVVQEMSRYTDVRIEIADPSLAGIPIGGSFEAGNIQGMLDSLEKVFGIEAEIEGPNIVRLTRRS